MSNEVHMCNPPYDIVCFATCAVCKMHFIQSRNAIVYIIFLELFEINILGYHMHNYTHKFTQRGGVKKKDSESSVRKKGKIGNEL